MQFGHAFKEKHFPASARGFVPVNHGSFGLPPQCVLDKYTETLYEDVSSPDKYLRTRQPQRYREGLQAVAQVLNCSHKNLALVTNATSGVNTILRSFPLAKGDVIALPSTTYGACANTVKFLERYIGIVPVVVHLDYPMSDAAVVAKFEETFRAQQVKLALFDTVASMPGVRMPYVELTKLCARYHVLSLVDGAHSVGLIPVDFADFQPDFYVSNLHKWLSLPRGCAVLYVAPRHHRTVQTMPVSHSYVDAQAEIPAPELADLLVSKFTFIGSDTFAAQACIATAIKFRNEVCGGEDNIRRYCENLARQAGDLAVRNWPGSRLLENDEKTLVTAMVTIVVPHRDYASHFDPSDRAAMNRMIDFSTGHMIEKHRTFVPFAAHNDKVVLRLSAQIYNEISDYEYAIDAAQKTLKTFFARESAL